MTFFDELKRYQSAEHTAFHTFAVRPLLGYIETLSTFQLSTPAKSFILSVRDGPIGY